MRADRRRLGPSGLKRAHRNRTPRYGLIISAPVAPPTRRSLLSCSRRQGEPEDAKPGSTENAHGARSRQSAATLPTSRRGCRDSIQCTSTGRKRAGQCPGGIGAQNPGARPRARRAKGNRGGVAPAARLARCRPTQGRVSGDPRPRVAQPARADPAGGADLESSHRDGRAEALEPRRHRPSGAAHVAATRRSARYFAGDARNAGSADAIDRAVVRDRYGRRDRAPHDRQ